MSEREAFHWQPAHVLAAELAQWGMDANLLKTAAAYMKQYPEADFLDWLRRLVELGELFKSSDQTERYRQQLRQACERLHQTYELHAGDEWAWVLGWAARLMPHYQANLELARRISPVGKFHFQRTKTFQRAKTAVEADIPEVREEVSQEAEEMHRKLQALWGKQKEESDE